MKTATAHLENYYHVYEGYTWKNIFFSNRNAETNQLKANM